MATQDPVKATPQEPVKGVDPSLPSDLSKIYSDVLKESENRQKAAQLQKEAQGYTDNFDSLLKSLEKHVAKKDPEPGSRADAKDILSTDLSTIYKNISAKQKINHAEALHQIELDKKAAAASLEIGQMNDDYLRNWAFLTQSKDVEIAGKKLKLELDLANAAVKGAIPKEALTPDPIVKPQQPSPPVHQEIDGLLAAINKANGRGNDGPKSPTDELLSYATGELTSQLKKLDDEKSLRRSPAGVVGITLGSILNIFPGELGTKIFGGSLSTSDKIGKLTQAIYTVSPLARTEVNEALGNRKFDSQSKLIRGGFKNTSKLGGDTESVLIASDVDRRLGYEAQTNPDTKRIFGESGLHDAFQAYRNLTASIDSMQIDPENANKYAEEGKAASSIIQDYIYGLVKSGAFNAKQLNEALDKVYELWFNSDYNKPADVNSPIPVSDSIAKRILLQNTATADILENLSNFKKFIAPIIKQGEADRKVKLDEVNKERSKYDPNNRPPHRQVFLRGIDRG